MGSCPAGGGGRLFLLPPFALVRGQCYAGGTMLRYSLIFLIVAIIAAVLGFGGLAGTAASIAKILFFVFLVIFVISLLIGRRPPTA
ncbi:hypothetical protein AW736_25630 [Termitidicoccus mucosus]|uniref:Uncharacterized protein n=2 Tax=Termitidicoccus mucosus TaxID=1184151 RepID=A0A178ICS3_9BACT|nr:hypothetical protein AW736_25630 [Opitutaceae bacterium TSB47]